MHVNNPMQDEREARIQYLLRDDEYECTIFTYIFDDPSDVFHCTFSSFVGVHWDNVDSFVETYEVNAMCIEAPDATRYEEDPNATESEEEREI